MHGMFVGSYSLGSPLNSWPVCPPDIRASAANTNKLINNLKFYKMIKEIYFKDLTKSKRGSIFTTVPATKAEITAAKKSWNNRGKNTPNAALKFGSQTVKCYSQAKSFGKQYFLAGDFTKVKTVVPTGTPMNLVCTDKPVINRTTKQPMKNLFWCYAPAQ
jgi:hypothetical protein